MSQKQSRSHTVPPIKPIRTGICLYNQANIICSWSQSAEEILAYKAEEILGKPVTYIFPMIDVMDDRDLYNVMAGGNQLKSLYAEKTDLFLERDQVVHVLSFSDQTDYISQMLGDHGERHKDEQSGLYDHPSIVALLDQESKRALRYKQPLVVVVIQIESYTHIEEKQGTGSTDLVVQTLAIILKNETRDVDFIGRLSEELFVIGLPSTGLKAADHVAARINRVAARYSDDETPFIINTAYTEVTEVIQDWHTRALELLEANIKP